jgi:rubrerythrin
LEKIQDDIIRRYHFQPIHHRFQTYGICEDCREHRPVNELQKHDTERIFARDAVKMALAMENRCLDFYRTAAKRNQDPGGKEIFERIQKEEENHIADLNAKLDEIVRQEKDLDRAPIFLHFDPCELEELVPNLSKYEMAGDLRLDSRRSTELALSLNRRAAEFFKAYAEKFAETQGKQILLGFAEQELNHCDVLRQRMEQMLQSASAT